MRIYIDTEFIEAGDRHPIYLVSLGAVSQNGHQFYMQNADAPLEKANDWVRRNVIPQLSPCPLVRNRKMHVAGPCTAPGCAWKPKHVIRAKFMEWVGLLSKPDGFIWEKPEFWGYYADYDWVVLCQMFGSMAQFPDGWPMYCRDIKQWADELGNPRLPDQTGEHNALADAVWNNAAWDFLADRDVARLAQTSALHAGRRMVEKLEAEVK